MASTIDLRGKKILVTGAGRGKNKILKVHMNHVQLLLIINFRQILIQANNKSYAHLFLLHIREQAPYFYLRQTRFYNILCEILSQTTCQN